MNLTPYKYVGIHHAKAPNEITKLIYRAKFLQEPDAVVEIAQRLSEHLRGILFDVIVPVNTTKTKTSLPLALSEQVALLTNKALLKTGLKDQNKTASRQLFGKRVLILDDVQTTGRTMRKAVAAVKRAKPEAVYFMAIAKR